MTRIAIDCLKCGHCTSMAEEKLPAFGLAAGTSLVTLTKRLICSKCGSKAVQAFRYVEDLTGRRWCPRPEPLTARRLPWPSLEEGGPFRCQSCGKPGKQSCGIRPRRECAGSVAVPSCVGGEAAASSCTDRASTLAA